MSRFALNLHRSFREERGALQNFSQSSKANVDKRVFLNAWIKGESGTKQAGDKGKGNEKAASVSCETNLRASTSLGLVVAAAATERNLNKLATLLQHRD